jgi:pre-mRNA-splicing factor RBM22/SLT11
VHKWKAPGSARQRETIVAREVAVSKNVCQCCLMDLEYGLPSHVVDALVTAVASAPPLPASEANREFFWDEKRRAVDDGRDDGGESYGKLRAHMGKLERIAAMAPYINPHKHGPGLVPPPRPPRTISTHADGAARRDLPPRDQSVRTVYITGVTPGVTERELARYCSPHGAIESITLNMERFCAHVQFRERAGAARCVDGLKDNLTICGTRLRVMWARSSGASTGPTSMPPGVRAASLPPGIRTHLAAGADAAPPAPSGCYPSTSFAELDAKWGARAWTDDVDANDE